MAITVTSTAFTEGAMLPTQYTCDGDDISPPLAWSAVPGQTQSIAVLCEDPDAAHGTFYHWGVYNLDPGTRMLDEGVPPTQGVQTVNDATHTPGYAGACPPGGQTHRYIFTVYALDRPLVLPEDSTVKQLKQVVQEHVLAQGSLMAHYRRL